MSVPLSATVLEIEYSAGELPGYQRAFAALCRCAELALDRGFRYLRIYERERLGPDEARWKLRLFHTLPEGAFLLDVTEPTWEGDPPDDGVLDAASFAAACREQPAMGGTSLPAARQRRGETAAASSPPAARRCRCWNRRPWRPGASR